MTDIVEFLTAQYDRIEKVALAATEGPWRRGDVVEELSIADVIGPDGNITSAYQEPCCAVEDATHIALHDPAYVLADIAAKRRIVELHPHTTFREEMGEERLQRNYGKNWEKRLGNVDEPYCETCHVEDGMISHDGGRPCETLRLLAVPFAGEPGYDEKWAVDA